MSQQSVVRSCKSVKLPFYSVRNVTCPEEAESNRKTYVGYTLAHAIVDLPTSEDVRDFIPDAEGRKHRVYTQVHRAIKDTLENTPQDFPILNSGITIVARECEIDEKEKVLVLARPSIINGAQTQGVIKDYYENGGDKERSPHVKFEIIVTDDEDLIAEVSIARNFQNDVRPVSIAGRLGELDELEEHLKAKAPKYRLQKSETQLSDDYVKTERLLQVIAALIPEELWPPDRKEFNKVYTYSRKAKCLKDFRALCGQAKDETHPNHKQAAKLYQFYLDIAAEALELYERWKAHEGFKGSGLRCIKRGDKGEIEEVPDGIIFPILASLSAFAKNGSDGWVIELPSRFRDGDLINWAKGAYMNIADSNPNTMGKNKACYTYLYDMTSLFRELAA